MSNNNESEIFVFINNKKKKSKLNLINLLMKSHLILRKKIIYRLIKCKF